MHEVASSHDRMCLSLPPFQVSIWNIAQLGGVALPSQRTLRDYTHCVLAIEKQLLETANISECQEWEKYVALILDEMHIKENLVFVFCALHSATIFSCFIGPLMGFIKLGETNDHLLNFECSLEEGGPSTINRYEVVFMVHGLFTRLQFPYSFPVHQCQEIYPYDPFWEAVWQLERLGFTVLATTADSASPNCQLIKVHGTDNLVYVHARWRIHMPQAIAFCIFLWPTRLDYNPYTVQWEDDFLMSFGWPVHASQSE